MNPDDIRAVNQDVEVIEDIRRRMHGKGTLADLLSLTAALEEIYERRCAAHGWRAVCEEQVTLRKLHALKIAMDEGTLSAESHMMQLVKLGIFTSYDHEIREALEVVKDYLMNR